MNKDHTNISPSQAYRFFNCPGSVQAQAKIDIVEPSSNAALEGIAIHELAAKCLKKDIDPYEFVGDTIEVKDNFGDVHEFDVTDDFAFAVRMYRNTILNALDLHGVPQSALQVETKCKIPEIDKYAQGTVDCSFIASDTLYVFDLKGGRGVIIDPKENLQCMYYALRPYLDAKMFISKVVITIVQPRAKEGNFIKTWDENTDGNPLTPARLEKFALELKEAIAKTRVKNPEFKAGSWCRWCRAEGNCPVNSKEIQSQVQNLSPQIAGSFPSLTTITPEQLGNALPALEAIKGVLENLYGYAFSLASKGIDIPNYSLVRGRKNRRYISEQDVIDEFEGEYGDDIYKPKEIRSPAQLEKLVGKDELAKFVEVPEGGLKLVPTQEAKDFISRKVEEVFKDVKLD